MASDLGFCDVSAGQRAKKFFEKSLIFSFLAFDLRFCCFCPLFRGYLLLLFACFAVAVSLSASPPVGCFAVCCCLRRGCLLPWLSCCLSVGCRLSLSLAPLSCCAVCWLGCRVVAVCYHAPPLSAACLLLSCCLSRRGCLLLFVVGCAVAVAVCWLLRCCLLAVGCLLACCCCCCCWLLLVVAVAVVVGYLLAVGLPLLFGLFAAVRLSVVRGL